MPRKIGEYILVNDAKLRVVIEGDGRKNAGIGEEDEGKILAYYDRAGGLVIKDTGEIDEETGRPIRLKIATGSFWDFKKKCPKEVPSVSVVKTKKQETRIEVIDDSSTPKKRGRKPKHQEEDEE